MLTLPARRLKFIDLSHVCFSPVIRSAPLLKVARLSTLQRTGSKSFVTRFMARGSNGLILGIRHAPKSVRFMEISPTGWAQ